MEKILKPPCFILLGRAGDIIQLLPCFHAIFKRTGKKPIVIVSTTYASVFDGVSYVQPHAYSCDWWKGVPDAYRLANAVYGGGVVPQWWRLDKQEAGIVENPGGIILQSHGHQWGIDVKMWPDYGTSMSDRCGFTRDEWITLPLVFDRRNFDREKDLAERSIRMNKKPLFLVNFTGHSSPFAPVPEVMNAILPHLRDCEILDLGKVTAHRIYDLLGLMDRAIGMITTDTATLHLAPAAKNLVWSAYTVDGWCSSVPKKGCVCEIKYNSAMNQMNRIVQYVKGVLPKSLTAA